MSTETALSLPGLDFRPAAAHGPRPFIALGHEEIQGWLIKRYAITASGGAPSPALLQAARGLAERVLPEAGDSELGHGVGFVIAHEGRDGNYVLVDWWTGENMLAQQIHIAPAGRYEAFERFTSRDIVSCVWEMQILAFEGRAWVDKVLSRPQQPDIDGYLGAFLGGSL